MKRAFAMALTAGLMISMTASADEIRVLSGGATKGAFAVLTPKFEQQTGHKVAYVYEIPNLLRQRILAGEKADVLVMPNPVLDGYIGEGKARGDARGTFGTVGIVVVVKEGAAKPDISTKEKFRDAMLAAHSAVYSTPGKTPSGTHLAKVMEELGIADAMSKKATFKPALEGGVDLMAGGQVDIGIYPASEVAGVKGVAVVGPMPPGLDLSLVYGAAATQSGGAAAAAFVKFMAAPENRAVWKNAGFDPPG